MKKSLLILAFALFIVSGCTKPTLPENYTGPIATIKDTTQKISNQKSNFFFMDKLNNQSVFTSVMKTKIANDGRGFFMAPIVIDHKLPAKSCTITLHGRTIYAAPILELMNPVYDVSGKIHFTPSTNGIYVVKGSLSKNYSVVWLEDANSGRVIDHKIEKTTVSK